MSATRVVYLVRHAIAEAQGPKWPDDRVRPLTPRGIARFQDAVRGLVAAGVVVDEIWTSPLVRAAQTAEVLAAGLDGHPRVRVLEALEPGREPAAVLEALKRVGARRRVALVGHQPDLGAAGCALLGASTPLALKKGGVCRVDFSGGLAAGTGTLVWLLSPKLLRLLGR